MMFILLNKLIFWSLFERYFVIFVLKLWIVFLIFGVLGLYRWFVKLVFIKYRVINVGGLFVFSYFIVMLICFFVGIIFVYG